MHPTPIPRERLGIVGETCRAMTFQSSIFWKEQNFLPHYWATMNPAKLWATKQQERSKTKTKIKHPKSFTGNEVQGHQTQSLREALNQLTLREWAYCSAFRVCPRIFDNNHYCHKKPRAFVCPRFLPYLTGQCIFWLTGCDRSIVRDQPHHAYNAQVNTVLKFWWFGRVPRRDIMF